MPLVLPFPDIDPVLVSFRLFGLELALRWYALAYIAGLLLGWRYVVWLCRRPALWGGAAPMRPEQADDLLTWMILGVILGGRLGYVLFYQPAYYLANPGEILAVWQGGMSFHGGFAGVTVAMILFARSRGIGIWTMFDVVSAGVPVGLGLVRLTNFINSELWGRPTDVPWAFVFPSGGPEPRHPSQLYEAALEGLVLFLVLRLLTHGFLKLKNPGTVSGTFLAGYGLSRIFVEFFRVPDQQLGYLAGGWLTMGMVLSTPMVLFGLWAIWRARSQVAQSAAA
jgi:phosphatidylglycerol:prolipoprotein diacylglycerol transferase